MTGKHALCDEFYCSQEYKNLLQDITFNKDSEQAL